MSDLPEFITVQEALDKVNNEIADTGFKLEVRGSIVGADVSLMKGKFHRDLYLPRVDRIYKFLVQEYNHGYIHPEWAMTNALKLIPLPIDYVETIKLEAERKIEGVLQQKEELMAI